MYSELHIHPRTISIARAFDKLKDTAQMCTDDHFSDTLNRVFNYALIPSTVHQLICCAWFAVYIATNVRCPLLSETETDSSSAHHIGTIIIIVIHC